ncbi:hypothetical protein QBE55_02015 [Eubacteriales bacterium mix99]
MTDLGEAAWNRAADALQNTLGLFGSQQKVQGFRCGDQDMRRPAQHFLTIPGWCVPCAHSLCDRRKGNSASASHHKITQTGRENQYCLMCKKITLFDARVIPICETFTKCFRR